MPRMNNYIMKDHPCVRDCPDRKPGCNCEKRQAFLKEKEARKAVIHADKKKSSALDAYEVDGVRKRKKRRRGGKA